MRGTNSRGQSLPRDKRRVEGNAGVSLVWLEPSIFDPNVRQQAMRALILVLFILGVAANTPSGQRRLERPPPAQFRHPRIIRPPRPTRPRQQSEDQIRLTKTKRRDVQRGLTRLGFDTKANGKFDDGDPRCHRALAGAARLSQDRLSQHRAASGAVERKRRAADASKADRADRRRGGRARHARGGIGGPIGAIGHVVGGIFGR